MQIGKFTPAQLLAYWAETFDPGQRVKDKAVIEQAYKQRERWIEGWLDG